MRVLMIQLPIVLNRLKIVMNWLKGPGCSHFGNKLLDRTSIGPGVEISMSSVFSTMVSGRVQPDGSDGNSQAAQRSHVHTGWNNASLVVACHLHICVIPLSRSCGSKPLTTLAR